MMLVLLALPAVAQAQFIYETNNGTITITGYTGPGGAVTIPSTISGLPVTSIGNYAFSGPSLTSVVIPASVTSIGDSAFYFSTSLTSVTLGNGLTNIGGQAFAYCTNLTIVTFGNGANSIGIQAFIGCTSLNGVYFQGNAPSVGPSDLGGTATTTVYYLPGTTGWSPTFGGRPTALWVLPYPLILNNGPRFGVQTNRFGFIISWATNISVVVEASTSLAAPAWSPVATNTLTDGSSYFSDPQWTNYPNRFYRLHSP